MYVIYGIKYLQYKTLIFLLVYKLYLWYLTGIIIIAVYK